MINLTRRQFLNALIVSAVSSGKPNELIENVRTHSEWAKRREKILSNMQLVMGPFPKRNKLPIDLVEVEKVQRPSYTQIKIAFLSEEDDRVPAYVLIPRNLRNPVPGVLCLHQTARLGKAEPVGLGGNPNLCYAKELAERGYVTLAPDYPNFGDYRFDPYQHGYVSATMKGIWNHLRAVDALQALPNVAADRIGVIGHSLGGHNALFVAAFDNRIQAVVTSCGFTSFKKYKGGDLTGWSHKGYMPLIAEKYGKDPARMPFDFPEVLAVLAPRPVFINAPLHDSNFEVSGIRDCVQAAMPIYSKVFNAPDRLVAVYPDAAHEFPLRIRETAYRFLDRWMR